MSEQDSDFETPWGWYSVEYVHQLRLDLAAERAKREAAERKGEHLTLQVTELFSRARSRREATERQVARLRADLDKAEVRCDALQKEKDDAIEMLFRWKCLMKSDREVHRERVAAIQAQLDAVQCDKCAEAAAHFAQHQAADPHCVCDPCLDRQGAN